MTIQLNNYKICRKCRKLTRNKNGYCDECFEIVKKQQSRWKEYQAKAGTAEARWYGTFWRKLRKRIMERDNGLCQECLRHGIYTPATDVDHIIPKAAGGTDSPNNLQCLCKKCHRIKTSKEDSKNKVQPEKHAPEKAGKIFKI